MVSALTGPRNFPSFAPPQWAVESATGPGDRLPLFGVSGQRPVVLVCLAFGVEKTDRDSLAGSLHIENKLFEQRQIATGGRADVTSAAGKITGERKYSSAALKHTLCSGKFRTVNQSPKSRTA